ncbi:bacteriohemerythrin [Magnetospirillum sp. UT-4]|uniref:bacteriohemerythrin n=1 Tax=Magnetospirillum sp. UT-4 TaxID=2681467 RepID=UPI00137D5E9E|nr:hemerythrin family protein [Magnetospirillum sp. UT-4]CAA7626975.1 Hemerythrin-like protein [Magnetospirillum sp. UT-4]
MLAWEDGYRIGHVDMDAQHLILFSLLNQIDINLQAGMTKRCAVDLLGALTAYIEYHFAHEEALMLYHGYPGLDAHAATHHTFVAEVARLRCKLDSGDVAAATEEMRKAVLDWLLGHILETDTDYVRFIAAKG